MPADASALLAEDCCLQSYTRQQLMAMMVQLLATIAAMPLDAPALLALNCCLTSYSERQLQAMTVQLLQGVVDGGGGGGGGGSAQIYTGAAPPVAPTNPALAAIFYPTGGGTIQQWDVAGAVWV